MFPVASSALLLRGVKFTSNAWMLANQRRLERILLVGSVELSLGIRFVNAKVKCKNNEIKCHSTSCKILPPLWSYDRVESYDIDCGVVFVSRVVYIDSTTSRLIGCSYSAS